MSDLHLRHNSKMEAIPDLMNSMAGLDDSTVTLIRKTGGRVSATDVISVITGANRRDSAQALKRMCVAFPEMLPNLTEYKFPGRGQCTTTVMDIVGVNQLLRFLPGDVTDVVRYSAGRVLAQYLEVEPIASPPPPPPPGPTAHEIEMASNARLQALSSAYQLAQAIESTSLDRVRVVAQQAIDNILLPIGDTTAQYVDAVGILSERGYTMPQINRLASELGRDLKMIVTAEGLGVQSNEQGFGPTRRQVGLYHRVRDAALIEEVLASFRLRSIHQQTMAGVPTTTNRTALLNAHGRGRKRHHTCIVFCFFVLVFLFFLLFVLSFFCFL